MILALLIAAFVDIVAGVFDAVETELGLKKNLSVEGNSFIVKIFGSKPSAFDLYVYNFAKTALTVGIAALAYLKGHGNISYIGIGAGFFLLAVDALKHVQGGLQWRFLLNGGKLDPDGFPVGPNGTYTAHSALAKFIGPWIW